MGFKKIYAHIIHRAVPVQHHSVAINASMGYAVPRGNIKLAQ
jgi:hypothetical protein